MEKERKKRRLINGFYIGIFAVSIVLVSIFAINIVSNYIENQILTKKQSELMDDLIYLGSVGNDAQEGYYIVFAENDYIMETDDGKIVIIYEMK